MFFDLNVLIGDETITMLSQVDLRVQLDKYLSTGNFLRADVKYVSVNIQEERMGETPYPRLFYLVVASSGMGKSQLAASLSSPVVYIPWGDSQKFYYCFRCVSNAARTAIKSDSKFFRLLLGNIKSANDLMTRHKKLRTVGLLVALFREMYGMTNEESLRVLSRYDGKRTLKYHLMSLGEAQQALKEFMIACNNSNNVAPIFFMDEGPSDEAKDDDSMLDYLECVFFRNFIRVMKCIYILLGTEASP